MPISQFIIRSRLLLSVLLVLLTAGSAHAEQPRHAEPDKPRKPADTQTIARLAAPFLNQDSIYVAHLQLDTIDFALIEKSANLQVEKLQSDVYLPAKKIKPGLARANKWLIQIAQAGATHLFEINSQDNLFDERLILAITHDKSDTQAIQNLMLTGDPSKKRDPKWTADQHTLVIPGAVLCASKKCLDNFNQFTPAPRPDLKSTLDLSPGGSFHLVFLPSTKMRNWPLPDPNGPAGLLKEIDTDLTPLSKVPCWLLTDLPNQPGYTLIATAPDAATAAASIACLQSLFRFAKDQVRYALKKYPSEEKLAVEFDRQFALLKPTAERKTIQMPITHEQFNLPVSILFASQADDVNDNIPDQAQPASKP